MGLTATDIDLLLEVRRRNLPISRIATIGRQSLALHPRQVARLQRIIPKSSALANYRWYDTADPILRDLMGAAEVVSLVDYIENRGFNVPFGDIKSLAFRRREVILDIASAMETLDAQLPHEFTQ